MMAPAMPSEPAPPGEAASLANSPAALISTGAFTTRPRDSRAFAVAMSTTTRGTPSPIVRQLPDITGGASVQRCLAGHGGTRKCNRRLSRRVSAFSAGISARRDVRRRVWHRRPRCAWMGAIGPGVHDHAGILCGEVRPRFRPGTASRCRLDGVSGGRRWRSTARRAGCRLPPRAILYF